MMEGWREIADGRWNRRDGRSKESNLEGLKRRVDEEKRLETGDEDGRCEDGKMEMLERRGCLVEENKVDCL